MDSIQPPVTRATYGRLFTIVEAATRLSISPRSLQGIIAAGRIPVVRIGRRVAVHPDDLEAFIAASRCQIGGSR